MLNNLSVITDSPHLPFFLIILFILVSGDVCVIPVLTDRRPYLLFKLRTQSSGSMELVKKL